jgi:hypothetical protein
MSNLQQWDCHAFFEMPINVKMFGCQCMTFSSSGASVFNSAVHSPVKCGKGDGGKMMPMA